MALDPREAIRSELMGQKYGTTDDNDVHAALMHRNGPTNMQHVAYTLQDKVSHAAKEVTLWLPRRSVEELKRENKHQGGYDTTLGHAIDAASYGEKIWEAVQRIARATGVNIDDIK